jgi:hypothetical protein
LLGARLVLWFRISDFGALALAIALVALAKKREIA